MLHKRTKKFCQNFHGHHWNKHPKFFLPFRSAGARRCTCAVTDIIISGHDVPSFQCSQHSNITCYFQLLSLKFQFTTLSSHFPLWMLNKSPKHGCYGHSVAGIIFLIHTVYVNPKKIKRGLGRCPKG
jgi:hypothetical protein